MVDGLSGEFDTVVLCRVLGASRSAYYAYKAGKSYILKEEKAMIAQEIKTIFSFHKRRYGWRRIQAELRDKGLAVGRHQIRARMQEQGLIAIQRHRPSDQELCAQNYAESSASKTQ